MDLYAESRQQLDFIKDTYQDSEQQPDNLAESGQWLENIRSLDSRGWIKLHNMESSWLGTKKLNLDYQEIKQINDRIHLRANLGPDPGFLSNTKNWKRTTPRSFRSPYYAQGDIGNRNYIKQAFYFIIILTFYLGFFSDNNKKYGQFFCAVQTFTGKVFAVPLPNVKTDSLIEAIHKMTQVLFSTCSLTKLFCTNF